MFWLCHINVTGICRRKLRGRDKEREKWEGREEDGRGKRENEEGRDRRKNTGDTWGDGVETFCPKFIPINTCIEGSSGFVI